MINRRGFIIGLVAAPAIVRVSSLMALPIRRYIPINLEHYPPLIRVGQGHLMCNGAIVKIPEFPELWDVIGSAYGGDGSLTFGLPNLSDHQSNLEYRVNFAPTPHQPIGTLSITYSPRES